MQERTEWHRVVCFDRLAEICGQYLRKGSRIYIEGSLRTRSWEQDGQKRYATEIIGREMMMLDGRGDTDMTSQTPIQSRSQNESAPQQVVTTPPVSQPMPDPNIDDEIPF